LPRNKSSSADDLLLAPWWVSAVLALLAYIVLPALLPVMFVRSGLIRLLALVLLAISVISALRSLKNKSALDSQTGLASLRDLSWKTFENILAEAYRRQGYKVEEMLGGGADGGIDLLLRKNGNGIVVQCKRWNGKPVPVQVVRELYGVMVDRGASAAKVVATTNFTQDALKFAKGKPIELVDSTALLQLVRDVQRSPRVMRPTAEPDHLKPACPKCGATTVLREARRGMNAGQKFWGCANYPRCRGTRPL
jgi:restriction system protein